MLELWAKFAPETTIALFHFLAFTLFASYAAKTHNQDHFLAVTILFFALRAIIRLVEDPETG